MAKARKTFNVEAVKAKVNALMLNSKDDAADVRQGASMVLESILHDSGNYRGFGYLTVKDMENSQGGTTVGVNNGPDGWVEPCYTKRFLNTDETRRYYN